MPAASDLLLSELGAMDEIGLALDVFNQIWGGDEGAIPLNVIKALAHTRHYLTGAWEHDRLVGASLAFGWGDLTARSLHSHITGVLAPWQGRGIGMALKQHQRAWASAHGYTRVTWTFDPLVRRNAWFNLTKLGARIEGYEPDFYGPMNDGINAGDPTDRCLVVWDAEPGPQPAARDADRSAPVELLVCDGEERPVVAGSRLSGAAVVSCQVPRDIIELRRSDPALGLRWRRALRDTMGSAIGAGFVASALTRDGRYILEAPGR